MSIDISLRVSHYPFSICPLEAGLAQLHANEYADLEPANGWGNREVLLKVATDLLAACRLYPDAEVVVR